MTEAEPEADGTGSGKGMTVELGVTVGEGDDVGPDVAGASGDASALDGVVTTTPPIGVAHPLSTTAQMSAVANTHRRLAEPGICAGHTDH